MNPYVQSVVPLKDFMLDLVFENGERRIFSMQPYLDKGIFTRLRSVALFRAARVVAGSVEWPGEIDLSYDTLYLGSEPEAVRKIDCLSAEDSERGLDRKRLNS
jgi:hypothetical protein